MVNVNTRAPGGGSEAGAIHESCGDVFGYGTERYVYDWYQRRSLRLVGKADWGLGEDVTDTDVLIHIIKTNARCPNGRYISAN